MKKLIYITIALLLTACSKTDMPSNPDYDMYKDGSYDTVGFGYGGSMDVVTTFKEGKLKDIVVKKHEETPSIGGVAIEQLIDQMIKKNDYDVDAVSGATKTSEGLEDAVEAAFDLAKNKAE